MTALALDSSAVVAWVIQEAARWRIVDDVIRHPQAEVILPGPVITETINVARRRGNTSSPQLLLETFKAVGMRSEAPTETDLVRAAELLALSESLSLGDALILSVTERLDIPIVTLDRYWLELQRDGHTTAQVHVL